MGGATPTARLRRLHEMVQVVARHIDAADSATLNLFV